MGVTFVCAIERVGGLRHGQQGRCREECAHCRYVRTGEHSDAARPIIEQPSGPRDDE